MNNLLKKLTIIFSVIVLFILGLYLIFMDDLNLFGKYNITYELDNGVLYTMPKSRTNGYIEYPGNPTKEGKIFQYWSDTPNGIKPFDFTTKVDRDYKLYAIYTDLFNDTIIEETKKYLIGITAGNYQFGIPLSESWGSGILLDRRFYKNKFGKSK